MTSIDSTELWTLIRDRNITITTLRTLLNTEINNLYTKQDTVNANLKNINDVRSQKLANNEELNALELATEKFLLEQNAILNNEINVHKNNIRVYRVGIADKRNSNNETIAVLESIAVDDLPDITIPQSTFTTNNLIVDNDTNIKGDLDISGNAVIFGTITEGTQLLSNKYAPISNNQTKKTVMYSNSFSWTGNNHYRIDLPITAQSFVYTQWVIKVLYTGIANNGSAIHHIENIYNLREYDTSLNLKLVEQRKYSNIGQILAEFINDIPTFGNNTGTLRFTLNPSDGFQQNVVNRVYIDIYSSGITSGVIGTPITTDLGINTTLTENVIDNQFHTSIGGDLLTSGNLSVSNISSLGQQANILYNSSIAGDRLSIGSGTDKMAIRQNGHDMILTTSNNGEISLSATSRLGRNNYITIDNRGSFVSSLIGHRYDYSGNNTLNHNGTTANSYHSPCGIMMGYFDSFQAGTNENQRTGIGFITGDIGDIDVRPQDKMKMFINRGGNVGIGTNNPVSLLHLFTDISGGGTDNIINSSDEAIMRINSPTSTLLIGEGINNFQINAFNTLNFATSRNIILNACGGNVGIGTTNPSAKLDISGNAIISGNIGIGTTNPQQSLHIVGKQIISTDNDIPIFNSQSSIRADAGNFLLFNRAGHRNWAIEISNNNAFNIKDENSTTTPKLKLTILPSGNVGIGKELPSQALDVFGNAIISGTITEGSQLLSDKYAFNENTSSNFLSYNLDKWITIPVSSATMTKSYISTTFYTGNETEVIRIGLSGAQNGVSYLIQTVEIDNDLIGKVVNLSMVMKRPNDNGNVCQTRLRFLNASNGEISSHITGGGNSAKTIWQLFQIAQTIPPLTKFIEVGAGSNWNESVFISSLSSLTLGRQSKLIPMLESPINHQNLIVNRDGVNFLNNISVANNAIVSGSITENNRLLLNKYSDLQRAHKITFSNQNYSYLFSDPSRVEYIRNEGMAILGKVSGLRLYTRIPIHLNTKYYFKIDIQYLVRDASATSLYIGHDTLDNSFNSLVTDTANSYNYSLASNYTIANNDSSIKTLTGVVEGYNPVAPTVGIANRFDPSGSYFDFVFYTRYVQPDNINVKLLIKNLEITMFKNILELDNGNVGINKTNPVQSLDVSGNAIISGTITEGTQLLSTKYALTGHTHTTADIISGTFIEARIPDLSANKITSGAFHVDRIPNLAISKITNLQSSLNDKLNLTGGTISGNLGINKTTTQALDVSGNAIISGTITEGGTLLSSKYASVSSITTLTNKNTAQDVSINSITTNITTITNKNTAQDVSINSFYSGGASTILTSNLATNSALISNASGKVAVSSTTSTELGYVSGVTSAIQTQLNGKAPTSHTHTIANITNLQTELNNKYTAETITITHPTTTTVISPTITKSLISATTQSNVSLTLANGTTNNFIKEIDIHRLDGLNNVYSDLSGGLNEPCKTLLVDLNGNLYAGGQFTTAGGVACANIARWNGSTWSNLGSGLTGGIPVCNALAVDSNNNIYAGGEFTTAGGVACANIARWNGSTWSNLGSGLAGGIPVCYALVVDRNGNLYVGGQFTTAGGVACANIAMWNGSTWSALGTGLTGGTPICFALAVDSNNNIYAGGKFTTAGGVACANIARWNGSTWSALGTGLTGGIPVCYSLAVDINNVYAGGEFTTAGGVACANIARWNGSTWSNLGTGITSSKAYCYALAIDNNYLYIGGKFTIVGGIACANIARWNGSTWSNLGTGLDSLCDTLITSNNNVFVGGLFTVAGGITANYITCWNVNNPSVLLVNGNLRENNTNTTVYVINMNTRLQWNSTLSRWVVLNNIFMSNVGIGTTNPIYALDVYGSIVENKVLLKNKYSSINKNILPENAVSTWTARTVPVDNVWSSVCWSPELGLFCAVAESGGTVSNRIMTSQDGINWTTRAVPAANTWKSICWSSELGLFCAVAESGGTVLNSIMTSQDGINWTARTSPTVNTWNSVCWSPNLGLFCTVASSGSLSTIIMTSQDGIIWTTRTAPAGNALRSVCWSSELGLFCTVASSGSSSTMVLTSPDGINWTARAAPNANSWWSVCWSSELSLFSAVARYGTTVDRIMISPDGINWEPIVAPDTNELKSICWSPELGLFCVVASSGSSSNMVLTSPNGINWTTRTTPNANQLNSICWSSELGIFCTVASSGTLNRVTTSTYTVPWRTQGNNIIQNGTSNVGINNTNPTTDIEIRPASGNISTLGIGRVGPTGDKRGFFLGSNGPNFRTGSNGAGLGSAYFGLQTAPNGYTNDFALVGSSDSSFRRWLRMGYNNSDNPDLTFNSVINMNLFDGRVGIGTTNPSEKLHIFSNTTADNAFLGYYSSNYGALGNSHIGMYLRPESTSLALVAGMRMGWFNEHIWLQILRGGGTDLNRFRIIFDNGDNYMDMYRSGFFCLKDFSALSFTAHSDNRIKKNIVELEDNECLDKLRAIKPCKYQYIDSDSRGESYVYGFIAQEIEEVLPYSTTIVQNIIPDYYDNVKLHSVDISFIEFDICDNIQYDLSLNQKVKVILEYSANILDITHSKKQYETKIINIEGKRIKIENETKSLYVHTVFLFGKEVNDFRTLKKDAIWTVATSALQEIDRIQQRHEQEIQELKSQNQLLLERLEALESRLA
ncbi:DUF2793 domain-containing protein [Chlorella virus XW01]|nr:DUF2793 domain-containing protein [Chlorella virus XW01]